MILPAPFVEEIHNLLSCEEAEEMLTAIGNDSPVSIRLNTAKQNSCSFEKEVPWCKSGYYLKKRLTFTFDPLFHAGVYYVQEAASMFLEQALRQFVSSPVLMLDLCAAPGGKSSLARSVLPEGSLLIANEVIRNRSQILAENLTKWGHPDVIVTNNDPADFTSLTNLFDVILTDVPCSGEGMFRKDEVAVSEWSEENVTLCWQRQRRILSDVWPSLKPGGLLVYSTCTYNTKEDEENVRWICRELGAEVLPIEIEDSWNITGNLLKGEDFPVYRFLPHKTRGEGLFLALLRKNKKSTGEENFAWGKVKSAKNKDKKNKTAVVVGKNELAKAASWISSEKQYQVLAKDCSVIAFPTAWEGLLNLLTEKKFRMLSAGCLLGELKGKDLIPQHALAMSSLLKNDAFPQVEIAYEQAIAYLRKETITLPEGTEKGYVLLTYQSHPLGFVKNIGNRSNNLYPSEWRIRSGYLPEEIKVLE